MQDNYYKSEDYDSELINLAYLIYKETKKTILTSECEKILTNILTDELFDNNYDIEDEKENKVKKI